MHDNVLSAGNQQGSRSSSPGSRSGGRWIDPSETTRRTPFSQSAARAYLQGAFHDGTWNRTNQRARFAQKNIGWLRILQNILEDLGYTSWIYHEGKMRSVYVLETQASFLTRDFDPMRLEYWWEKVAYVRGFFDAEGGMPRISDARFYVQFVQKNREKLEKIRTLLEELGIAMGVLHNPSSSVDPDYWRVFVRARSYKDFICMIGSWHPEKVQTMRSRVKI